MTQKPPIIIYGVNIIAGLLLLPGCSARSGNTAKNEDEVKVVKTEIVKTKPVEQTVVFAGSVEPFEQAYISSSTPVRIKKIYKEVGDVVGKGDLLIQMDASNYRQAKAQLENLEIEYARLDTLFRVGSISQQQLDQMATQLDVARTSFDNLIENTQLLSPINGIVTARYYEDGEMFSMSPTVDGRSAILSIMDINPVKVTINVPEEFFPLVDNKLKANLTLDVYADKIFEGSLFLKYPTVDPASRTFTVELQFPNNENVIRPGMFGRISVGFGSKERVLAPDMAVLRQTGTNDRYVFAVENGRVVRKTVKIGRLIEKYFEIIEGLNEGEEIVVSGFSGLLDGMPIKVID